MSIHSQFTWHHLWHPFTLVREDGSLTVSEKKVQAIFFTCLVGVVTCGLGALPFFYCFTAWHKVKMLKSSEGKLLDLDAKTKESLNQVLGFKGALDRIPKFQKPVNKSEIQTISMEFPIMQGRMTDKASFIAIRLKKAGGKEEKRAVFMARDRDSHPGWRQIIGPSGWPKFFNWNFINPDTGEIASFEKRRACRLNALMREGKGIDATGSTWEILDYGLMTEKFSSLEKIFLGTQKNEYCKWLMGEYNKLKKNNS